MTAHPHFENWNNKAEAFSFYFDGDAPPAPVPMLVERLIPREGLTFLGGQSGAGKTMAAVDLVVAIASGGAFFGYDSIERAGAIYVAAEGRATISSRVAAAKKARDISENLPIAVVTKVPDLAIAKERAAFIATLKAIAGMMMERFGLRVGLVVLDTMAAAFTMKDENSAAEIGAVCKAAVELGDSVGAATLVLAHYGKDASTGIRGSSSSRGFGESIIAVLADRDETTGKVSKRRLIHPKSRSGEEGPIARFELRHVDLGLDDRGEPFGAAYVEVGASLEDADASAAKKDKRPARATLAYLDALGEALIDAPTIRPYADGPLVKATDRENVRAIFYPTWPADGDTPKAKSDARGKSFSRGEADALVRHLIGTREIDGKQFVWRATQSGQADRTDAL